ncbi:hypothetical protein [Acinetobacter brisouii]|uniref:hypothetical protein n=1 Tax=Acinetobacter brisouii TaxID=396323 RepID=UPI00124E83A6|nr:hypothetical protein [Acinetobacter brisouii]
MTDQMEIEILEGIVNQIEANEIARNKDLEEFTEKYNTLSISAVDELNDEVLKNRFFSHVFVLLKEGKHSVYRANSSVLSAANMLGGEEFKVVRFERGAKIGEVCIVFKPVTAANYQSLVVPVANALEWFDGTFTDKFGEVFGAAITDIQNEIVRLKREYKLKEAERERSIAGDYSVQAW